MDRGKAMAGLLIYVLGILLPTVGLLLANEGIRSHALERIIVGFLGIIAAKLAWQSLRAPAPFAPPQYWALNPWALVAGVFVIYLAWFTNLPHALAGNLKGSVLAFSEDHVVPLDAVWPRVVTSVLCALGLALLVRGVRSKQSPEQRRALRIQKRMQRAARAPQARGRVE